MNPPAVFPSNLVARWVDPESFDRERDAVPDPSQTLSRDADAESTRKRFHSQLPRLRYRPFERLASVRMERAS